MRLREQLLCHLDTGGADGRDPGRAAPLQRPAPGEDLPRRRRLGGEGGGALREALTPAPRRPEVDVHEPRARVELERGEIRTAPTGAQAIVLRPNKRRQRIVNMPLTPAAEAIVDKAPPKRRLILKPARADAWSSIHLSREVRDYATRFGIRRDLRFNDLRGTKVTELVWSCIGVADLAVRMGWKLETAAKMMGIYAALNPGRAR